MSSAKKQSTLKKTKDYLRLPFEVYYSGPLHYINIELMTSEHKLTAPELIRGVHIEEGRSYGAIFYCANNSGAELNCCASGLHGELRPKWLRLVSEDDLNINQGDDYGVTVESNCIDLQAEQDEEADYLEPYGGSLDMYVLEDETPDHLILDADGDRITVNSDGYLIDENGDADEQNLFVDFGSLADDEAMQEFGTLSREEAQDQWIAELWLKNFPKLPVVKITKYAV